MIFRIQKTENYVMLDKLFINDRGLSLQAKGMLTVMLSLPNDWRFNEVDLVKRSTNGRDAVRAVIKELQQAGYIVKEQKRESGKFAQPDFAVHERPVMTGTPSPGKPATVKPATDKPATENPTLLSNNVLSNKLLSNKELKDNVADAPPAPQAEAPDLPFKDVVDYLNMVAGTAYKPNGKKTQQLIRARINDGFGVEDFKKVVDIKTAAWRKDRNMVAYLRPDVLFGTKFEGYLNEWRLKRGTSKGNNGEKSNIKGDVGF